MTDTAENDIPGAGSHLECRPTTVQLAFRGHCLRSPLSTFAVDVDIREVASLNRVSVGHFNGGADGNREVAGEINSDITCTGFKPGVGMGVARREKLGDDAASARFRARGRNAIQFDAATTSLRLYGTPCPG